MVSDRAQQVLRQAILRQMGRRAIAARARAEWKKGKHANRESETNAATVNEAEAGSDAGKGGPTAI